MRCLILLSILAIGQCRKLPFIVGGEDVDPPGRWPWQASLERLGSHSCGASLISANHASCAAHCLSAAANTYRVVVGMHDRTTRLEGDPTPIQVQSYVNHPMFVRDGSIGFPFDAAVIRLAQPADTSSEFIGVVAMAPEDNEDGTEPDYTDTTCYITGWGRLYGFGPLPNILQEAEVDVLTEAQCRAAWGAERIQRWHICLGDLVEQDRGACNGDSGGPLVCQDENDNWVMAGITSWGRTGCVTTSPSVYVRVSYFRDWFNRQIGSI